jgi:hypothetical protein
MREKDVGALDEAGWLVRAPRADGTVRESCAGTCSAALREWLASVQGGHDENRAPPNTAAPPMTAGP